MPKKPLARQKQGPWTPGARKWVRGEIRDIFAQHKTPKAREQALVKQLGSASKPDNADKNALALLDRMRRREMKKVVKADKAPKPKRKTSAGYHARFLGDMKERIFTDFKLGDFGSITGQISAIGSFGKERNCREYTAEVLEGIAQGMKQNILTASSSESREAAKDLLLRALDKAIDLHKESGNLKKSRTLEIQANNIANTF